MSQFSYSEYTKVVAKAQSGSTPSVKIGFFKLNEGAQALVRINLADINELQFATVHKPVFGKKYEGLSNPYAGISCINPLGSRDAACPLCEAAEKENAVVGKAEKKVFVQMLVAYKENGKFSEPVPVVWERPAGFSKELAAKIANFGNLKDTMFVVTRNGAGKDTKYVLDYAVPAVFKPELIPADFSAFDGFKVNRHSYWEKTVDEIRTFLETGSFPVVEKTGTVGASKDIAAPVDDTVASTPVVEAAATPVANSPAPATTSTVATTPEVNTAPAATESKPARNFGTFNF